MSHSLTRLPTRRLCKVAVSLLVILLSRCALGQADVAPGSVDQLATTNEPATIRGEPGRQRAMWNKFDARESKRVDSALSDVIRRSEDLWTDLVEHLGDNRHCKTVGIDAGYPRNWSVADVCQRIIGEMLSEAYYRHMEPGTKEIFHQYRIPSFAKDKAQLRKWCLARKDRKLFELQMEASELAIAEITASELNVEQRMRLVMEIKKEIEGLKKSQMAVRCRSSF